MLSQMAGARSPVRPEGSAGAVWSRLMIKPPTHRLSARSTPSLDGRPRQAGVDASAPFAKPLRPRAEADVGRSEAFTSAAGGSGGGGALAEPWSSHLAAGTLV